MSQVVAQPKRQTSARRSPQSYADFSFEDASPFGVIAMRRDDLKMLKPEHIGELAIALAMRGTRKQIRDPEFAEKIIANRPDWVNEFQVIHLIEKSLWINGQSDLVMLNTPNPSQIPDNPPQKIMDALVKAYGHHPSATVWYGVPLFHDETNEQGLPLPVTAKEAVAEHAERIREAQKHALRWRAYYHARVRIPAIWKSVKQNVWASGLRMLGYAKKAQRDSRARERAKHQVKMEYMQTGRSWTEIPEHTTTIGRLGQFTSEAAQLTCKVTLVAAGGLVGSGAIGSVMSATAFAAPALTTAAIIIPCDPFLFVELPEEPGKLRFVGHWYWQRTENGKELLHLHL